MSPPSRKHIIKTGFKQGWGNPRWRCTAPVNFLPRLKIPRLMNTLLTEFENRRSTDVPTFFFTEFKSVCPPPPTVAWIDSTWVCFGIWHAAYGKAICFTMLARWNSGGIVPFLFWCHAFVLAEADTLTHSLRNEPLKWGFTIGSLWAPLVLFPFSFTHNVDTGDFVTWWKIFHMTFSLCWIFCFISGAARLNRR